MDDIIKKVLYTGVGIVAFTAEKLRETVDKLVSEEKLTTEEGKKLVEEFVANTETKKVEFETQLRHMTEKVVKTFSFATSKDIEDLTARIEALEAKMTTAKPSTKKVTS